MLNTSNTQKAVAYVRVSSLAQVRKGQGAESQAARCAEFARMKGYEIVRVFEDSGLRIACRAPWHEDHACISSQAPTRANPSDHR